MDTRIIVLCLSLLFSIFAVACSDKEDTPPLKEPTPDAISINSGTSSLSLLKTKEEKYYPKVTTEGISTSYLQEAPVKCEIVTRTDSYWIDSDYETATLDGNKIVCTATINSKLGSKIQYVDIYQSLDNNLFEVTRSVTVLEAKSGDAGFSSRYTLKSDKGQSISKYDFFVPSIWYKDNAYVKKGALASDYADNDFWFREDRLPLPFIMLKDKSSGATFSIVHKDPDGSTFKEERGLDRIIDGRMKFASVGLHNNSNPEVGITYPGSEGKKSYLGQSGWAYRNHPMNKDFQQTYKIAFRLTQ